MTSYTWQPPQGFEPSLQPAATGHRRQVSRRSHPARSRLRADDWQALRPQQWRGLNLLGDIFMKIRCQLNAEHGPGLSNGIVTVDEVSFTTRIKVHSGPSATSRYGLEALLDIGSPQTFISAEAWARIKVNNAGSDVCEPHVPPRSWGKFRQIGSPPHLDLRSAQHPVSAWRHPFRRARCLGVHCSRGHHATSCSTET